MSDRLITAPTSEPVSVAELKAHLRVTATADDAYLGSLITAAREYAEQQTGRALAAQTRETTADAFPRSGVLPLGYAPAVSISSVKYLDVEGVEQTLESSVYAIDTRSEPGALLLAVGKSWPDTAAIPSAVRVQYTCGAASSESLKLAIKLVAAWWYEQRLPVNVGNIVNELPNSLSAILWSNRVLLS